MNNLNNPKNNPKNNPDPTHEVSASCRAQRAPGPGMVLCLTPNSDDCKHQGRFDTLRLCLNPLREKIIAQTERLKAGN
jgi:hypothetical protein